MILAAFAAATTPIMNSMYQAMQQMQAAMDSANGRMDITRGPNGIEKVSRSGRTLVPRRNPSQEHQRLCGECVGSASAGLSEDP